VIDSASRFRQLHCAYLLTRWTYQNECDVGVYLDQLFDYESQTVHFVVFEVLKRLILFYSGGHLMVF
jgi:hypothetical protein